MTRHHFAAFLFVVLSAYAVEALATVSPLPGSNLQHTTRGVLFPNPVGVQVMDAAGRPAAGATVRYNLGFMSGVAIDTIGCYPDVGYNCTATADENGVAILRAMSGSAVGAWTFRVFAALGGVDLGTFEFQLFVDAATGVSDVSAISGSGQRAVIGTPYAQPLVVRVVKDGAPLPNAAVYFVTDRNPEFYAPGPPQLVFEGGNWATVAVFTDPDGYARSGAFTAGWGVGTGTVTAGLATGESTLFTFTNTSPRGDTTLDLEDMWWRGPDEAGWGVAVHQRGSKLFSLLFAYDDKGNPTWRVMSDGYWYAGLGSNFRANLEEARGSPFSAYDVSAFSPKRIGDLTISFFGEQSGEIGGSFSVDWLPPGWGGMYKKLRRWDFSGDSTEPLRGVADIWWGGGSQAGWGVSIFERPGAIFALWFTYDDSGKATWYVMPEGRWTSQNVFEGRMFSATGPGTGFASGTYDVSRFKTTDVGPFRLRFLGPDSAELDYSVNGRTGTLVLGRYNFD